MKNKELEDSFKDYLNGKGEFLPYYPGMNVLTSPVYRTQLKEVLNLFKKEDIAQAKSFEMYHDTIIFNMHTKVKKYKQSKYFKDVSIKDIENQGYTIPFYIDEKKNIYVLLGLMNSN